jgi:ATPase family protein associated with various cellular activities (AAA)
MDEVHDSLNTPGAYQMAAWTLRLADSHGFGWLLCADPHLFGLFYATCAATIPAPGPLADARDVHGGAPEKLLPTLRDLQRQFGDGTSGRFARLYLHGTCVFTVADRDPDAYRKAVREWREAAEAKASQLLTSREQSVDWLTSLLGLEEVERKLLIFQLSRHQPGFAQLFDLLMGFDRATASVLAAAFNVGEHEIVSALSENAKLVRSGLLHVHERPLRIGEMSTHLRATLTESAGDETDFLQRFVMPLAPSPTTSSLARLHDDDERILRGILRLRMPDDRGLHALVYGPKAVDKCDMVARLLREEHLDGFAVVTKQVPAGDLPSWVYIAQRHMENAHLSAVLVVDRAHEALASRNRGPFSIFGIEDEEPDEVQARASDEGLTGGRVRCVWLSDRAKLLSERNLGAFLFHCEALPGSRADRRKRVTQVIFDNGLSAQLERDLTKYSLLGERQVRQAAGLARMLSPPDDTADRQAITERERVIRRAVAQSQKVLGRDHTEGLRDSVTRYSLDHLNIAGRFTPRQIITALRKRPRGSLCFWGIPGAGKTQLAEHIAVELDLPLLMRSASDLLSKWLGETEQHIAAMFDEAEGEGALLFLDEADSFLRDRTLARAEWSVTQVNELLQSMERFEGVFIAATNLMDSMDAAAMRRFTWKLEFKALTAEQAWAMFCAEADFDPETDSLRAAELEQELGGIPDLAPGDFATVKRQANMLGEQLSPDAWLEQLGAEAKAKMFGLKRQQLGFADRSHD